MESKVFLQNTVKDSISIEGVGIHSGEISKIIFHPAEDNSGITFLRNGHKVKAHVENVIDTSNSTSIGDGIVSFRTIEHIMAALYLADIDNVVIEFTSSSESPIMDGSACEFFKLLDKNKISQNASKMFGYLSNISRVQNGDRYIMAKPYSDGLSITFEGFFGDFLKNQIYTYNTPIEKPNIERAIISARTFCHIDDISRLKQMGLAKGGSLENNVVLTNNGVLNQGGLRHTHEPVSHKILDLIGDLYLGSHKYPTSVRFSANIYSYMGGHKLNIDLLKEASKSIKLTDYSTTVLSKVAS